jgi:hypothetical protein
MLTESMKRVIFAPLYFKPGSSVSSQQKKICASILEIVEHILSKAHVVRNQHRILCQNHPLLGDPPLSHQDISTINLYQ